MGKRIAQLLMALALFVLALPSFAAEIIGYEVVQEIKIQQQPVIRTVQAFRKDDDPILILQAYTTLKAQSDALSAALATASVAPVSRNTFVRALAVPVSQ